MSQLFTIGLHNTIDKSFIIYGPDDFKMEVDYDDVDHEFQDLMAKTIVAILNNNWSMREVVEQARILGPRIEEE